MSALELFKEGPQDLLITWHFMPLDCACRVVDDQADMTNPDFDDLEENLTSAPYVLCPLLVLSIFALHEQLLNDLEVTFALRLIDEVIAEPLPVENLVNLHIALVRLHQTSRDKVADSQGAGRLLVHWVILVNRQLSSALIADLLKEEASELWYSEVAESDRLADKGPLVPFDALEMSETNAVGQDSVNELLVGCNHSFLAGMQLFVLLGVNRDQQVLQIELVPLQDSDEDLVVLFTEELIDIVAELQHVLSRFNENSLCPHQVRLVMNVKDDRMHLLRMLQQLEKSAHRLHTIREAQRDLVLVIPHQPRFFFDDLAECLVFAELRSANVMRLQDRLG